MRGSIVKRGSTYSYVLDLGVDAAGKRRQKWVGGFRTREEAEAALGVALGRVPEGTFADAGRLRVREFLATWLDGAAPRCRRHTLDGAPLFFAVAPEVAALPTDRAGSTVRVAVTFRDGAVTATQVSIPELFRRTP